MIRINTNGLLDADRTDQLLATCRDIQRNINGSNNNNNNSLPLLQVVLSVPIMTHDPDQYEQLMHPILLLDNDKEDPGRGTVARRPHERVQNFVRACVAANLAVEVTAVQRPDVDQSRTEACVAALGISPNKRMMMMRWRKYFA